MTKFISFIILTLVLTSCSTDYRDYYYDLDKLKESKYYVFESPEDSTYVQYLKKTSNVKNNELTTEVFNSEYRKISFSIEIFDTKSSKVTKYNESPGPSKVNIIDSTAFTWKDISNCNLSFKWNTSRSNSTTIKVIRNFDGYEVIYVFNEPHDALRLKDEYYYIINNRDTISFWQYSFFTKEHNLAKTIRTTPDGSIFTTILVNILNEKQWNEIVKKE